MRRILIAIFLFCSIFITAGCGSILLAMLDPGAEQSEQRESVVRTDDADPEPTSTPDTSASSQEPPAGREPGTQNTTPDSSGITFEEDDWPMIEPYIYGGPIQVGVPVYGVISESKNFHQFTLSITEGREVFGLSLVITADSDEEFEIYFSEAYDGVPHMTTWNSFYESSAFVSVEGRTMTITYPCAIYTLGEVSWQINCPEYQWGDGPEDPYPSDLRLHFRFFLDPEAEGSFT